MSDTAIGFLLAIVGSFGFGAYILPRKLSRLSVLEYQYWLSVVIAPICLLAAVVAGARLLVRADLLLISFGCGPLWTLGSLSYSSAVDHIGVARSTPIKNFAPVFAAVYGIWLFHEYTLLKPVPLAVALGGVLLMVGAACVIGRAGAPEQERALAYALSRSAEERRRSLRLGALYSLGAALAYGSYAIPLKHVLTNDVSPYTACAWLGVGVFLSSLLAYRLRYGRFAPKLPGAREVRISQTAGAIWTTGQITGTVAMVFIPMSISWPVSNLSTLFAVAWGVWVFREIRLERHTGEVVLGLALYAIGLALLAFAAPSGRV